MFSSMMVTRGVAASLVALGLPFVASATPVTFDYFSQSAGDIAAQFTLDVTGGVAQNGTGTISSAGLGSYNLVLLTGSSLLPANNGSINPTPGSPSYDLGSGFTWHGVSGSGGADFIGDAVVNATPNYFDDYGLIFAITDKTTGAYLGGINIYANVNSDPSSLFATNLSLNGTHVFENSGNGTLAEAPATVPEPSALLLAFAGLGALALVGKSRRV